jgi:hypothetical protein
MSTQDLEIFEKLINSPVGESMATIARFALDWYDIWHCQDTMQRRHPEDAERRWKIFSGTKKFLTFGSLRKFQQTLTDTAFFKLSEFLHNPRWESTNNGAERYCRNVRHIQKSRYSFRSEAMIASIIEMSALADRAV